MVVKFCKYPMKFQTIDVTYFFVIVIVSMFVYQCESDNFHELSGLDSNICEVTNSILQKLGGVGEVYPPFKTCNSIQLWLTRLSYVTFLQPYDISDTTSPI